MNSKFKLIIKFFPDLIMFVPLIIFSLIARIHKKKINVGIGPEALINNVYHKKALELYGYSVETFAVNTWFITKEFDIVYNPSKFKKLFVFYFAFIKSIFRYECLYFYFNGGSLWATGFLWRIEPYLYKIANVKTVVMPYGSDVQDLRLTKNKLFKEAVLKDYPNFNEKFNRIKRQVNLWTKNANIIISGCDWVEYMNKWDVLTLGHFSIDTTLWKSDKTHNMANTLKILHAPNHRNIKGTQFFIDAVNELKQEGCNIELLLLEKVPNDKIRETMEEVDVVADQLIIGWYAMFAIEGMSLGKPVLCYIRKDFEDFYIKKHILKEKELPIVNCNPENVKEIIKWLYNNKDITESIGNKSIKYIEEHHSLETIGKMFDSINREIGIKPARN